MVRLLNNRTHSINDELKEYVVSVMGVNILIFLGLLFFFAYVFVQHRIDTTYFLKLNDFYKQLESVNQIIYQDILEDDMKEFETVKEMMSRIQSNLNHLKAQRFEERLKRDLEDLKCLYQSYYEKIRELYEWAQGSRQNDRNRLSELYEEAQRPLNFINKDFKIVYSQILNNVEVREQRQYQRNFFCLGISILVLLLVVRYEIRKAGKLTEKIAVPIKSLAYLVNHTKAEELSKISPRKTKESGCMEIIILEKAFFEMLERIQKQMEKIIKNADLEMKIKEKELENLRISNQLKSSELKALQMQINPHFLFNTLNMIAKTAYLENAEKTVFLMECTADLLRYTLDYAIKPVSLEKEIEMLGNYVYLQEKRFGKRIEFLFDLDERFHFIKVPSFILQPLVENAIVHGVGNRVGQTQIKIKTRYIQKNNMGILEISDNGLGMDTGILSKVCERLKNEDGNSQKIGLGNVWMRLRLFFGEKVTMAIRSEKGEGTEIQIAIPVHAMEPKGGLKDVQGYYSG